MVSSNQLREKLTHMLWQKRIGNKIRVLDTSYNYDEQNDGYKDFYQQGHIPSSVYFNPRQCSESTPHIPFNLPDTNCFTDYVQSLGVSSDTHIVTYDRMDMRAALRAWWLFRLYGHDNISILDGGLKKWVRDGYPVTTDEPEVERGNFETRINRSFMRDYDSMKEKFLRKEEPIKVDQSLMTDFDTMEETAHVTEEQIIDIRGSGAFHKTIQSDSGEQKAHIPGAKNIPYAMLFNEDETFKSIEDLKEVFKKADVDLRRPFIGMCSRGVTGCALSAVAELLGKPTTPLYYGSWYEWSRKITQ